MTDISQQDLYELFGINETSTASEIRTAFRQKALTCHPDKFPNNEEKKQLFLNIKKALEILIDEQARKVYDGERKQKKLQQERLSKMDDKRKKFKEDLERNEQKLSQTTTKSTTINPVSHRLQAEIDRLRRENNRLIDEELEKVSQLIEQEKQKQTFNHIVVIIKYLPNTSAYSDQELRFIFQKYGDISTIINMYPKRALIEFNDDHISNFIENEKGFNERPFASVKIQKQKSTTIKQPPMVDLTKPELEDYEAMIFKKIAAQTTSS